MGGILSGVQHLIAPVTVQVSRETWKHLNNLKIAWELPTYDQVIQKALAPHRIQELKALELEVKEPE